MVVRNPVLLFLVSLAAFHLVGLVGVTSDASFLLGDYGKRLFVIALCLWLYGRQLFATADDGGAPVQWRPGVWLARFRSSLLLLLACSLVHVLLYGHHMRLVGFRPPQYPVGDILFAIDMTLGLALVAVSEELVFRKLARDAARRISRFPIVAIILSAIAFASIHVDDGRHATIQAFLVGLVFMAWYVKRGQIMPLVIAHYVTNLLIFTGQFDSLVETLVGTR